MQTFRTRLPLLVTLCAVTAMLVHGPIAQLADYHDFADKRIWQSMPNAADVLSNLGFFIVGAWGMLRMRTAAPTLPGMSGYRLFLISLMLTALGSTFYHLAPDNSRLIWDRLPIALACAGLLAGVRAQTHGGGRHDVMLLAALAVFSVAWWHITGRYGDGDLRPYLLLQGLPLVLIPLWLWIYRAPRIDWMYFGGAIIMYIAAKAAELHDRDVMAATGILSGHTLKHLLATGAAALLTLRITASTRFLSREIGRGVPSTSAH